MVLLSSFIFLFAHANLQYNGPVVHLNSTESITKVDSNASSLAIVEFYAPWCPHCQHFAPIYGAVATQFKDSDSVHFFAVNCEDNAEVCNANNITGYPTVKAFVKGEPIKMQYSDTKKSETVSAFITDTMTAHGLTPPVLGELVPAPEWQHIKKTIIAPSPVRTLDLATTLFTSFRQITGQVPEGGRMPVARTQALRRWLLRLATLPGLRKGALAGMLAATEGGDMGRAGASRADLEAALGELSVWGFASTDRYSTLRGARSERWSACAGPGHGYPCGLWQLLHALTVHTTATATATGGGDAKQVLVDIRDFVDHFFPCQQCRTHFLDAVGAADGQVLAGIRSRRDAVLWLWRTHNEVSQRLAPEWGVRDAARVVYPPPRACEACRGGSGGSSERTTLKQGGGAPLPLAQIQWEESRVLEFLDSIFLMPNAGQSGRKSPAKHGLTLLGMLKHQLEFLESSRA